MKLGFFSDPHLGVQRTSNTTTRSAAALREVVYDRTVEIIGSFEYCHGVYCLGDLFDTPSNNENTIMQGYSVLSGITGCIAGNHDIVNRAGAVSSLQLLKEIFAGTNEFKIILNSDLGSPYTCVIAHDNLGLTLVPHAMTQKLFCESLDIALNATTANPGYRVLGLHCNVGVPGYADPTDDGTTLFLTQDYQERLLNVYDRILVGHEHVPHSFHQGRLQILGNVFPLGFGEIANRYRYVLDTETCELEAIETFNSDEHYLELPVGDLLASNGEYESSASLVQITGLIKHTEYADLARSLAKFWKLNDNVLMVKNAVQIEDVGKPGKKGAQGFIPRTLPELVDEAVANTSFKPEYDESVAAAEGESESS